MTVATADQKLSDDSRLILSWIAALALHAAVGALIIFGLPQSEQVVVPQLAIKGVMIDNTEKRLKREKDQAEQAEADRAAREKADAEAQAESERAAREKQEAEKLKEQQAQLEIKKQEEQRQKAALEQKRKADEKQAEVKRQADEKQAAIKRQADEKKRADEIKAKQAEKLKNERDAREQAQRESELKRQLADEEGRVQAESSGMLSQYAALIAQRVERNWNKPGSAKSGLQCIVKVTQAPGGTVLSVQVEADKCNGDAIVRQTIEAAVYKSSPLPPPPDARLFQRVLVFRFKPTE